MGEYLEFMYAVRSGVITHQKRLAEALSEQAQYTRIPVERSGGGV